MAGPEAWLAEVHSRAPGDLLAQTYRLQRFGLAQKGPPPDSLLIAPLHDLPDRSLEERVTLNAMPAQTGARERDISEVSYLVDLRPEVGENRQQVLPPAADPAVAVIRGDALQLHRERRDLDIGGREFEKASRSRRLKASCAPWTSSTFLFDIGPGVSANSAQLERVPERRRKTGAVTAYCEGVLANDRARLSATSVASRSMLFAPC